MSNDNLLTQATEYGVSGVTKVANMEYGAQLGMGLRAANLDAATPIVFPPAVIVVMQTPTMYSGQERFSRMLKTLVECHAKSVTGIDIGYELEQQGSPVGHDGQEMQVPTRTTRTAVSPSMTFQEVSGNLVWNIFRRWIWDIQHPDTNVSMADFATPGSYLMTTYAMSLLAIQFDPTHLPENIIDTVFITNMFPTGTGELQIERTIGTSKVVERSISFTGLAMHNEYIRGLGRKVATDLNLHKANFNYARTHLTDGAMQVNLADTGLDHEVKKAMTEFTPTV